jgi:hypothetical protein
MPHRFRFSLRRLMFWVVPLVAMSALIASCEFAGGGLRPYQKQPSEALPKAVAIGVIFLVWAVLVWEDHKAIAQPPDSEHSQLN